MLIRKIKTIAMIMVLLSIVMGCSSDSENGAAGTKEGNFYKFEKEKNNKEFKELLSNFDISECKFLKEDKGFKITFDKTAAMYYGELKDNRPHGKGILFLRNDNNGEGAVLVTNYVGDFKNGYPDGFGMNYIGIDKMYPVGGIATFLRYEGYFEKARYTGKGNSYSYDSSDLYVESSKLNNYINKNLTQLEKIEEFLAYSENKVFLSEIPVYEGYLSFSGEWDNHKIDGKGTAYYKNGNIKIEGEFKKGRINGEATSYYEDGSIKYKGEFKKGNYSGKGILYDEAGKVKYKGEFVKGEPK